MSEFEGRVSKLSLISVHGRAEVEGVGVSAEATDKSLALR